MREFVYLDEVSVYSLTSSPDRPPASAMTESSAFQKGTDYGTEAEVGSKHLARAGTHSNFTSSDASSMEIQRRFNIQSLFAILHQEYSSSFLLKSVSSEQHERISRTDDRAVESTDETRSALVLLAREQRALRLGGLRRGDLIELPISLDAHPLFSIVTTAQAIGDMMDKQPTLAGAVSESDQAGFRFAASLKDLMIDLVPIEGTATDHVLVESDAEPWIVERGALSGPLAHLLPNSRQLRVAGVTETERYWKDTRRVLHANLQYDVLARVSTPELRTDWAPIKMLQAFQKAVPEAGDNLARIIATLPQVLAGTSAEPDGEAANAALGLGLIASFASYYEIQVPPVRAAMVLAIVGTPPADDVEVCLAALTRGLDELHSFYPDLVREAEIDGRVSQLAWRAAHAQRAVSTDEVVAPDGHQPEPDLLEVEFIGIYW